jgi:hypothetical protein
LNDPNDPPRPRDEPTDEELDAALAAGDEQLLDYVRTHAHPVRTLFALINDETAQTVPIEPEPTVPDDRPLSSSTGPAGLIAQRIHTRHLMGVLSQALASLNIVLRAAALVRDLDAARRVDPARDRSRALDRVSDLARDLARDLDLDAARDRLFEIARSPDPAYFDHGPGELVRILTRDLALTLDRAHDPDPDLAACLDRARDLVQAHLFADLTSTRDLVEDLARAIERAFNLTSSRDGVLAAEEVVASGADLSELSDLSVSDLELLVGMVWDRDTRWAPGVRERVAACSREISPGVYRVVPDGNERDPHEVLSS